MGFHHRRPYTYVVQHTYPPPPFLGLSLDPSSFFLCLCFLPASSSPLVFSPSASQSQLTAWMRDGGWTADRPLPSSSLSLTHLSARPSEEEAQSDSPEWGGEYALSSTTEGDLLYRCCVAKVPRGDLMLFIRGGGGEISQGEKRRRRRRIGSGRPPQPVSVPSVRPYGQKLFAPIALRPTCYYRAYVARSTCGAKGEELEGGSMWSLGVQYLRRLTPHPYFTVSVRIGYVHSESSKFKERGLQQRCN